MAIGHVPGLPPPGVMAAAAALAVVAAAIHRSLWPPALVLLGFCYAAFSAAADLERRWPDVRWNDGISAAFRVLDFPRGDSRRLTLQLAPLAHPGLPRRIRVSWYEPAARPAPGEVWQLTVRLRAPRGFANPGPFDYERWLFVTGIGATGYVVARRGNGRLRPAEGRAARLRSGIVHRLRSALPADRATAVLIALSVGSRHAFDPPLSAAFVRTGTSHLMAISGLHVGLVAAIGLAAGRAAAFAIPAPVRARRLAAAVPAMVLAMLYSALAGFALPTQRACLMLAVALAVYVASARPRPWPTLLAAGLVVCLLDPLAPLGSSFRLSFGAVALLLLLAARDRAMAVASQPRWRRFLRWQLGLSLLSVPLTLVTFGQFSVVGPLANLALIPWFSFVVVPGLFLGLLLTFASGSEVPLALVHATVEPALALLFVLSAWPAAAASSAAPTVVSLCLLLAALALTLAPLRLPRRAILAALALPAGWPAAAPRPPAGCVDIAAFDVGQGQAVALTTARHSLLYDTGPGAGTHAATATRTILPALPLLGLRAFDRVVVSHGDSDHAGGLDAVRDGVPVALVLAPPGAAIDSAGACRRGAGWVWDDVAFEFLHPPAGAGDGNDSSCVLRVASGRHALLLSGDVERAAEQTLLDYDRGALNVDLLIVPHHGSATSSTAPFVAATTPREAWISAGYRNRWRFPADTVVERYVNAGARVRVTGVEGMLSARLCAGTLTTLPGHRQRSGRIWRAR